MTRRAKGTDGAEGAEGAAAQGAAGSAAVPDPPVLTVLVAAWNAAGSIERALASVLEVSDVALECLVVDDGSTDGTADVVRGIARRDPRVRLLLGERNEGVSAARNRGLAEVRGDWLTLLDADDRFLPGGLATLAGAALGATSPGGAGAAAPGTATPPMAVIGQQVWTDGRRRWLTPFYDIPDIRRPGRTSLAARPGLLNFVSPHAKLLRRECWEGLTFEGRVLGDQPWVIRALLRAGSRIDVLGETVYEWHRPRGAAGRPGGGSRSITAFARADVERGLEALRVAADALAAVEAEARLTDPSQAESLVRAYVARLLAMDVAPHIGAALTRSDPAVARLFDATGELLRSLPPDRLRDSTALARSIVELPLRRWWRVPATARPAYWRLFATALAIDPGLARHGASPVARIALRLAARGRGATNRTAAAALLMAARLADGARRVVSGAVRRVRGGPPGAP